ncbi:MAG: ABC transporter permease [Dehalococcoidia bacterium]|nr:ABC transporter permease [Dehalococcoidia bacterium]
MTAYIIRRLIGAAIVLALLSVIVFSVIRAMPGSALLVKLGETGRIPEEQMDELRAEMGLDDPIVVQYVDWISGVVIADFGDSLIYDGRDVLNSIGQALPVTLQLAATSMLVGLAIGISFGILSAVFRGSVIDYAARIIGIFGISAPIFWVALVLILYGALWFNFSVNKPYQYLWDDPLANLRVHIFPSLVLGLNLGAVIMRYTRSAMLEVLRQDYMRTATAKGLASRAVVIQHGLRNALIPILTLVGTQFAFLLSGTVIIEIIFRYPGLGKLTFDAILQRDYTVIQGATLIIGAMVILTNLLVDLAYGVLDPRVRYS